MNKRTVIDASTGEIQEIDDNEPRENTPVEITEETTE